MTLRSTKAPPGRSRWTVRPPPDEPAPPEILQDISHETARRTLKGTSQTPRDARPGTIRLSGVQRLSDGW